MRCVKYTEVRTDKRHATESSDKRRDSRAASSPFSELCGTGSAGAGAHSRSHQTLYGLLDGLGQKDIA